MRALRIPIVLSFVLILIIGTLGWLPTTAAAPATSGLCADQYNITKPPPKDNELPGYDPSQLLDTDLGDYSYDNPGENAAGIPEPTADDLDDVSTSTRGKTPGSKEHVYSSWKRYLARKAREGGQPLSWDTWLNTYIPNQGNANRGAAYEKLLAEHLGLGGDWRCQEKIKGAGTRKYDAVNHRQKVAFEFKAGDRVDPRQVAKDATVGRLGYRVHYVFGRPPTPATVRLLQANGIGYSVLRSNGVVTNPAPGNGGTFAAPGQNSSGGAAERLAVGSGRNAAIAREVAAVNRRFQAEQGLIGQGARQPGGIDWTTLELNYLALDDSGDGVRYSFAADENPDDEEHPSFGGQDVTQLTSDAFFTWLALPNSSFWVNLNPDQPDQVIDDRFATTDAGRVLLEADFALKHHNTALMRPESPTGKAFWDATITDPEGAPCMPGYRIWIEPKPASVRQQGDELYILDAPLQVKLDKMSFATQLGHPCVASQHVLDHNFELMRQMIIPTLEQEVNTHPDFESLRQVYRARIAAEWVKQRDQAHPGPFHKIIGSGDVSAWPARTDWDPQAIFRQYRQEFLTVQFRIQRRYDHPDGSWVVVWVEMGGGVIFDKSPRDPMSRAEFRAEHPQLPRTVRAARSDAVTYRKDSRAILGGDTAPKLAPTPTPSPTPSPKPSPTATTRPTATASAKPTAGPTVTESPRPTARPTSGPTRTQTARPTASSTATAHPSHTPTSTPTVTSRPSTDPTNATPSASPSDSTGPNPTHAPSGNGSPPRSTGLAGTGGPPLWPAALGAVLALAGAAVLLHARLRR